MSTPRPTGALVRKRTDTDLMPPPLPAAKKIKRPKTVLEEDTYIGGLARIIARDFFPALLETETKQEYLDALESKDPACISRAARRLQHVMTPGRARARTIDAPARGPAAAAVTPARTMTALGADTPVSVAASTATAATAQTAAAAAATLTSPGGPAVDTNMSLTAFQAVHTSEDNESFYALLDRQNQHRVEKYSWAWNGNQLPSRQLIQQAAVRARLSKTRSLIDDGFKRDRLAIRDRDERPAMPATWKSTGPMNSFMFPPADVDPTLESPAQRAQAESKMGPKEILYENTAMPDPSRAPPRPASPTASAVADAIAGRPRDEDVDSTVFGGGGGETPRVNGYAFVDDQDSAGEEEAEEAEPIDLGPGDATPNPFRIADARRREALHERMVERIAESKRTESRDGGVMMTPALRAPSSPAAASSSAGVLTPAGRRLWSRLGTPVRTATPMGPGMAVFDTPRGATRGGSGSKSARRP